MHCFADHSWFVIYERLLAWFSSPYFHHDTGITKWSQFHHPAGPSLIEFTRHTSHSAPPTSAMASSLANTSVPLHELIFQQFLHDVHHAYLLLHRAMALLPPTMIPNMEPEALPSTGVWDQPEGLLPHYSAQTNAYVDNFFHAFGDEIPIASPVNEEDKDQHDEQDYSMLPEPHTHVSAPDPAEIPDTCRFSNKDKTPAKRPKPKTTPKAPAKRQRRMEKTPPRSPSPTSTWTLEEKKKLRLLKADERSRYSWKAIASKLGKSVRDVTHMWKNIKDDPEWTLGFFSNTVMLRTENSGASLRSMHTLSFSHSPCFLCAIIASDSTDMVFIYLSSCSGHVYNIFIPFCTYIFTASCHCAPISIDIVPIAPWPSILYLSHHVQDPHREDLRPRRRPLRFIEPLGGLLLSIDHTDPLSLCLTSSQCNNSRPPTHTSTFSLPRSQATFLHQHMTACFKLQKWFTRATLKASGYLIFRHWLSTHFYTVGRFISRSATSTSPSTPTRESYLYTMERLTSQTIRCWTFSIGSTLRGKLINISMPSLPAPRHLYALHLIQIPRTSPSRSKFESPHADILSFLLHRDKQTTSTRYQEKGTHL